MARDDTRNRTTPSAQGRATGWKDIALEAGDARAEVLAGATVSPTETAGYQ